MATIPGTLALLVYLYPHPGGARQRPSNSAALASPALAGILPGSADHGSLVLGEVFLPRLPRGFHQFCDDGRTGPLAGGEVSGVTTPCAGRMPACIPSRRIRSRAAACVCGAGPAFPGAQAAKAEHLARFAGHKLGGCSGVPPREAKRNRRRPSYFKSRESAKNGSTGLAPSTISAIRSPTAGPCLNPWPDPPPASHTFCALGWRSRMK
jgi:hypothetical protein